MTTVARSIAYIPREHVSILIKRITYTSRRHCVSPTTAAVRGRGWPLNIFVAATDAECAGRIDVSAIAEDQLHRAEAFREIPSAQQISRLELKGERWEILGSRKICTAF